MHSHHSCRNSWKCSVTNRKKLGTFALECSTCIQYKLEINRSQIQVDSWLTYQPSLVKRILFSSIVIWAANKKQSLASFSCIVRANFWVWEIYSKNKMPRDVFFYPSYLDSSNSNLKVAYSCYFHHSPYIYCSTVLYCIWDFLDNLLLMKYTFPVKKNDTSEPLREKFLLLTCVQVQYVSILEDILVLEIGYHWSVSYLTWLCLHN